jgi:hypothetical protein
MATAVSASALGSARTNRPAGNEPKGAREERAVVPVRATPLRSVIQPEGETMFDTFDSLIAALADEIEPTDEDNNEAAA